MITSGTIKWLGTRGGNNNTGKTVVRAQNLSQAKMQSLAEGLQSYSDAVASGFSLTQTFITDQPLPAVDSNMDECCVIVMQEVNTGAIHRYRLPALLTAHIAATNNGDRLNQAIGEAITALFATLLGVALRFIQGWIEKRR